MAQRNPQPVDDLRGLVVLGHGPRRKNRHQGTPLLRGQADTVHEIEREGQEEVVGALDHRDPEVGVGMVGEVLAADRPDPRADLPVAERNEAGQVEVERHS